MDNKDDKLRALSNKWHINDHFFACSLGGVAGAYLLFIVAMLVADIFFTSPHHLYQALYSPEILYSIQLSLISCTASAILSILVGIPVGYLLARYDFMGKKLLDAFVDIPIVLPPLVIGLSLLILFQTSLGKMIEQFIPFTYSIPGVILAQFTVASAFSIRTLQVTFDQINSRREDVARTLGCSRAGAFFLITLPEAQNGILAAGTLAWARSLGEFGPILVFAGATRMKTEVLPTTVFLELSIGNIEAAVAVSLLMILTAVMVLTFTKKLGLTTSRELA